MDNVYVCITCGQVNKNEAKCLRCDMICERCQYRRRSHVIIESFEICPIHFFMPSDRYTPDIG